MRDLTPAEFTGFSIPIVKEKGAERSPIKRDEIAARQLHAIAGYAQGFRPAIR